MLSCFLIRSHTLTSLALNHPQIVITKRQPKPNRGFRRDEGGWVDGRWAFMVARGWGDTAIHR